MTIEEMAHWVEKTNRAKGWYDKPRRIGDEIALIHSEVSEAYEEVRVGRYETELDPNGKPVGFASECADIFIRLLDTCNRMGVDLEKEFTLKMNYNEQRTYRHGNKAV